MANMSYCRFENTYNDLLDCYEALSNEEELSKSEEEYKNKLLKLCTDITMGFNFEEVEKQFED